MKLYLNENRCISCGEYTTNKSIICDRVPDVIDEGIFKSICNRCMERIVVIIQNGKFEKEIKNPQAGIENFVEELCKIVRNEIN